MRCRCLRSPRAGRHRARLRRGPGRPCTIGRDPDQPRLSGWAARLSRSTGSSRSSSTTARSAEATRIRSTSGGSRSSTSSRTIASPCPAIPGGPYRLVIALRNAKLALDVRTARRRAGRDAHAVALAVPLDPAGLLADLRELLRRDPNGDARPDRGDRHGPARAARRGGQPCSAPGSRGRSPPISPTMRRLFTLLTALHWKG